MSDDLVQQLEKMEQRWKRGKEQLATKEDIWGVEGGAGGLSQTIQGLQKRLKCWMVGGFAASIAFAQLLRYVLETYF